MRLWVALPGKGGLMTATCTTHHNTTVAAMVLQGVVRERERESYIDIRHIIHGRLVHFIKNELIGAVEACT